MRVSAKGQVTIPKDLRELAGIRPNGEVLISIEGSRIVVEARDSAGKAADRRRLEGLLSALKRLEGTGDPDVSADDVMAATRDR
ncbi:MAG: AbrB/MazE/SpoVT family DNA-binding domain-containing protein [Notoacmeibacter sp.]|nr:AbrB/MazE/SpoVT family DNA-binding domain-containing protein [Notoacmeibacter sp.]MCC0031585.1 AbrB/MazE/SpoVT family DNA-binding domain-containing protein [Brucellaceae bacterium]